MAENLEQLWEQATPVAVKKDLEAEWDQTPPLADRGKEDILKVLPEVLPKGLPEVLPKGLPEVLPKVLPFVAGAAKKVQEAVERVPFGESAGSRAEIKEPYGDWGDMFIEDRIADFNAFKDSLKAGLHRADHGIAQTADRVLEYFGLDDPVRKEQMKKAKAESEALDAALIPTAAAHPDSTWLGDATSDIFVTSPAALVGGPAILAGTKGALAGGKPVIKAIANLISGGAKQGAAVGAIGGATDIVDEGQEKLPHITDEAQKGAMQGGVTAPAAAIIPRVVARSGKPFSTVGNAVRASGDALHKQAGLAGGITAALGGGDPISGLGITGAGAKGVGSWMANVGAKIQSLPAKYRTYIGTQQGEKALAASIFMLQQRDPEFREVWNVTETE
jgi:hypothetical protein